MGMERVHGRRHSRLRTSLSCPRQSRWRRRLLARHLHTAGSALERRRDSSDRGQKPDAATNPPVRILVVDDDPVMRRAVIGSLQTAFERPESADSGKAALTLAAEKTFDVIFTDVQMP